MSVFDAHRKALDRVLARSTTDLDFRRRLLTDPHGALADVLGPIPPRWRVRFIEKDPDLDALVVLPDVRTSETFTEAELDQVAGGKGGDWEPLSMDDEDGNKP
jgi:hypothetical protein